MKTIKAVRVSAGALVIASLAIGPAMNSYSQNHYQRLLWKPMLKICLGTWLLVVAAGNCLAYEFTIEGEIQVRDYYRGNLAVATNYNFTVEVRDCNSRIRVFGGWHQQVEYHEYGWDGKSSYMLVKFWRDRIVATHEWTNGKLSQAAGDKPVKPTNDAVLSLYLSDIPKYGHGMEPVWLAYATPCHYNARKSGDKAEPVWYMGAEIPGQKRMFTSVRRMSESFPGFLESMTDLPTTSRHLTRMSPIRFIPWSVGPMFPA